MPKLQGEIDSELDGTEGQKDRDKGTNRGIEGQKDIRENG
jgi:hypothetical protein